MLEIEQGSPVDARVVIIFTGVQYRRLSVPGLDHFEGTSVFHAARSTCPHVRHSRRWTHGEPIRRHSSHPSGVRGTTGRIALRCGSGVENDEEMAMAVT